MGIRKGRGIAIAAVTLGVALSLAAGTWFWEDLLEWIAFQRLEEVYLYNDAAVSIFDPNAFPRIKALRKRFLRSLTRWDPALDEFRTNTFEAITGAISFLKAPHRGYWPGDRFRMDYYNHYSSASLGVVFTSGGGYFCEEETWNRFVASIIEASLPELKATLEDGSAAKEYRVHVAHALSWVIPSDPAVLAFLRDALDDEDSQDHAVYALASIGHWAKPAVPRLLELLKDKKHLVNSLGKIGDDSPAVISALVGALSDEVWGKYAAIALGRIGPGAVAAVPALERILAEEDGKLQTAAGEALKRIRDR